MDGVFTTEEMYDAVTDETARLLRLVEDLSVLSKTAEHSLSLETGPVRLSAVAMAATDRLRLQYADRSVDVDVTINSDPEVAADERRLIQVVTNLLANALGHVDEGGTVNVVVEGDGASAYLTVTDDGVGIRPGELDLVFDRSFAVATPGGVREAALGYLSLAVSPRLMVVPFWRRPRDPAGERHSN